MIDWLNANKEWIFSGVGVLIVVALFRIIPPARRWIKRKFARSDDAMEADPLSPVAKAPAPQKSPPDHVVVPGQNEPEQRVFIREKSAQEVYLALKGLPPLRREYIIEKSYVGLWVKWVGRFSTAYTSYDNIHIILADLADIRRIVSLKLPPNARTRVEQMREGDEIHYEGTISAIESSGIYLNAGILLQEWEPNSETS